jgi:acyl carrier protein
MFRQIYWSVTYILSVLDSVDLVMEIEKHFKISITDKRTEQILTISDFVNYIIEVKEDRTVKDCIARESCLAKINMVMQGLYNDSSGSITLGNNSSYLLEKINRLNIPIIEPRLGLKFPFHIGRSFWSYRYKSKSASEQLSGKSVSNLIDGMLIHNYRSEFVLSQKTSRYTIHISVAGIVCKTIGVDAVDIEPNKQFVRDYGVDS